MAKQRTESGKSGHKSLVKRTKQGGKKKTATMNKHEKRSYKKYGGQGK
jgi:hypothetical protein